MTRAAVYETIKAKTTSSRIKAWIKLDKGKRKKRKGEIKLLFLRNPGIPMTKASVTKDIYIKPRKSNAMTIRNNKKIVERRD